MAVLRGGVQEIVNRGRFTVSHVMGVVLMILTYCIRHKPNATLILDARHYTAWDVRRVGDILLLQHYRLFPFQF